MKKCSKCGETKPESEFFKRGAAKLRAACKVCSNPPKKGTKPGRPSLLTQDEKFARHRESNRRWRECNSDYNREWRERNPNYSRQWNGENRDRVKATEQRWLSTRPGYRSEKKRQWLVDNPGYATEMQRQWRARHPEAARIKNHIRRARKRGSLTKFTHVEWAVLCARYDNCCLCCGIQSKLTPDHIVPLSRGGSNAIDNIQPLCMGCNLKKGTKSTDYRPRSLEA